MAALPFLVAIVGGSGSGKTWLADLLKKEFGAKAGRLSLDDFYRDRSHLPPGRRARINFDHPRAIDWQLLERTLQALAAGKPAEVPQYDFATHCRSSIAKTLRPRRIIIVDGLWLLHRASVRSLFSLSVFIECPAEVRLLRRIERDGVSRGRTEASVRAQFAEAVEPMNQRFVKPQSRRASLVLSSPCELTAIRKLVERIREISEAGGQSTPHGRPASETRSPGRVRCAAKQSD